MKLPDFSKAKVIVFGDVMLDRYWHGDTLRISPEAPVPVVHVKEIEDKPGGAGNVAANISSLTADAILFSMCGDDETGNILTEKLEEAGVSARFQRIANVPTITKLRVLSLHQQLIRLDFEDSFHTICNRQLVEACQAELASAGALVLSDYGKGGIQHFQTLIAAAKQHHVPVLVDPKSTDFSLYQGATMITPNYKEFEAVVGHCSDEQAVIDKGTELINFYNLEALLITRGAKGMTLLQKDHPPFYLSTQAREVYDVTGAGDTVIGVLATCLATGKNFVEATTLANIAAGLVVGKIGAASVSIPELQLALHSIANMPAVLKPDELAHLVKASQMKGEKVVMTNGCFDILHSGHVMYLEQAKALGSRLIVAVNDDDSVRRHKGKARPINNLERRMAVLSGLSAVDWVVPFSEDTPEKLIEKILPDILVKGGDWQVHQIAGANAVLANGGEVKVLGFEEGISTSAIVAKIAEKRGEQ